jgi:hypothetical protein
VSELVQLLTSARDFVSEGWCQNASQIDNKVCAGAAMVLSWKILRGIPFSRPHFTADDLFDQAIQTMMAAINELDLDREWHEIPYWNDHPERTHQQVLDAFDRALKIAERDG